MAESREKRLLHWPGSGGPSTGTWARRHRCRVAAAVASAALLVAAAAALRHGAPLRGDWPRSELPLPIQEKVEQFSCQTVERDVDYWTGVPVGKVAPVTTRDNCKAACEAALHPPCGAWTWGRRDAVPGLAQVCFLKALAAGQDPERRTKLGVESGLPCPGGVPVAPELAPAPVSTTRMQGATAADAVPSPSVDDDAAYTYGSSTGGDAADTAPAPPVSADDDTAYDPRSPTAGPHADPRMVAPSPSSSFSHYATTVASPGSALASSEVMPTTSAYAPLTNEPAAPSPPATTSAQPGAALSSSAKTHKVLKRPNCMAVVKDIDFWTMTSLYDLYGIKSAEACRAKCEEDHKCGAWTWGTEEAQMGLTFVCFLKRLAPDQQPDKQPKKNVISGFSCPDGSDEAAAPAASSASSESSASPASSASPSPAAPAQSTSMTCGLIEDNTDYWTKQSIRKIKNVATAELCLEKCELNSECGAWTWGKKARVEGLTNVCFLKGLSPGEYPDKHHKDGVQSGLPCHNEAERPVPSVKPSTLFCFALMLPRSYEQGLLAMQANMPASLFTCEAYAVYSNETIQVTEGLTTNVINSNLKCGKGGEFGTALNTDIFETVWQKVVAEGTYLSYDWTAKVDPDAVFIATRLRSVLTGHPEASPNGVYLNNCWRGMHGPVEVLSRNAVGAVGRGWAKCEKHFTKLCSGPCQWGEDMFLDQCLSKVLDVRRDNVFGLLLEEHCDPPKGWKSCEDHTYVAYHPFKDKAGYKKCLGSASASAA